MSADRITVTLEGGEALVQALRALDGQVKAALRRATLAASEPVVDVANAKAPGPHIEAEVVSATENRVTVAVGPDKEHWYYRFAERGAAAHEITGVPLIFEGRAGMIRTASVSHPGMAARPFLRPAMDEESGAAEAAMGATLRAAIGR